MHDRASGSPDRRSAAKPAPIGGAAHGSVVMTWTVRGVLFGLAFPVFAILMGSDWGFDVVGVHRAQSIMYVVDLAPLVLGATGALLGRTYADLIEARQATEATVVARTAELERALDELGRAQSYLVQAQKLEAIGSLAAGVAHEINTPIQYVGDNVRFLEQSFADMSGVQGAALQLSEAARGAAMNTAVLDDFDARVEAADLEFLNEEVPSAIAQALEGVGRVSEIVRALKDFSHPGSGEKEPSDINAIVANTIAVSRSEWKYVADVETRLDETIPEVRCLAGPLGQALLVIIVNAAQALEDQLDGSDERGSIVITTGADAHWATIDIEDDAGGIPAHLQERIFDPFFTTKDVGRGSGQGLGIAHSAVVDQHGGRLDFTVRPGEGTTFRIALPLD